MEVEVLKQKLLDNISEYSMRPGRNWLDKTKTTHPKRRIREFNKR